MTIDTNLDVDEGENSTNIHQYRVMIGSLLYLWEVIAHKFYE
jgi:hypothetical protein